MRPSFLSVITVLMLGALAYAAEPLVRAVRVPEGGIQPQVAVDEKGVIHLIYFKGDPRAGDAFYVTSKDSGASWSKAIRVNSEAGSVVAAGNIRGAQLALGKNSRAHVAWMGSMKTHPDGDHHKAPLLYARMNDKGDAFEPQRNIITKQFGLDGGGSIAADGNGRVFVAWHAGPKGEGEAKRRVWLSTSRDEGKTFAAEYAIDDGNSGVCGCCGMKIAADDNMFFALYRSAKATVNRDMMLVTGPVGARAVTQQTLQPWNIATCPMSSAAAWLSGPGGHKAIAWEAQGRVSYARVTSTGDSSDARFLEVSSPVAAPRTDDRRNTPQRHPSVAADQDGRVVLAWSEGVTWGKGGNLKWQVFDAAGKAIEGQAGEIGDGVPAWSLVAACAKPGGGFILFH